MVYKEKALVEHPDKNPGLPEATLRFQKLNAAYSLLCDRIELGKTDATKLIVPDFTHIGKPHIVSDSETPPVYKNNAYRSAATETGQEENGQEEDIRQMYRNYQKYGEMATDVNVNPYLQKMYENQCAETAIVNNVSAFIRKEFTDDVSKYTDMAIRGILRDNVVEWNEFMLKYTGSKKQKIYVKTNLLQKLWRNG